MTVPAAETVSLRQVLEHSHDMEPGGLSRDHSNRRKSSKEIEMVKSSLHTKSRALSDLVNYIGKSSK